MHNNEPELNGWENALASEGQRRRAARIRLSRPSSPRKRPSRIRLPLWGSRGHEQQHSSTSWTRHRPHISVGPCLCRPPPLLVRTLAETYHPANSAQAYLHQHVCTSVCAQAYVHKHMCTSMCAQAYVHKHMCTSVFTPACVHKHLCSSCSSNYCNPSPPPPENTHSTARLDKVEGARVLDGSRLRRTLACCAAWSTPRCAVGATHSAWSCLASAKHLHSAQGVLCQQPSQDDGSVVRKACSSLHSLRMCGLVESWILECAGIPTHHVTAYSQAGRCTP
jgi:hypothetical protein